ncbi:MAG: class I SAM-dependent methyltransferase [Chloroflexi bacterium]|nr:class I SAM-dependent methyltransferase [Chloroflexota bacterium]
MKARPFDVRFEIRLAPPAEGWTRAAYDDIYRGEGIRQLDSFYHWLLQLLDPRPGRRLLDVACGEGALPNLARERYQLEAYGSDLAAAGLRIARSGGSAGFVAGSGETLPFADRSFDYVTCIGSLEHFLDMEAGVRELARVLRPAGTVMILVPNTYSLTNNIYSALKFGRSAIDDQPLQRYLAHAEWVMLLEANGLEVVRTVKYERTPPDNLADLAWYLGHWRDLVRVVAAPLIPTNLATCFVFLCRHSPESHAAQ